MSGKASNYTLIPTLLFINRVQNQNVKSWKFSTFLDFVQARSIHCSLQWRHNKRDGVSNHRRLDCLLSRLFWRRSKKTPKLRVTGLCGGNSPVTGKFTSQTTSNESPADYHQGPAVLTILNKLLEIAFELAVIWDASTLICQSHCMLINAIYCFWNIVAECWDDQGPPIVIRTNTDKQLHQCLWYIVQRRFNKTSVQVKKWMSWLTPHCFTLT